MGTVPLLEIGRTLGLIVLVWFGLFGWKLLPLGRSRNRPRGVALG